MKHLHLLLALALSSCAVAPDHKETIALKAVVVSDAPEKPVAPAATSETIVANVNGIVCSFCVQGVTKRFNALGKSDDVFVSLEHRKVVVAEKPGQFITGTEFAQAIREAGFKLEKIERTATPFAEIKSRLAHTESKPAEDEPPMENLVTLSTR